jgi:hypothetical protein
VQQLHASSVLSFSEWLASSFRLHPPLVHPGMTLTAAADALLIRSPKHTML